MPSSAARGCPSGSSAGAPCWLEVDLDAICENVRAVRRLVESAGVMAVVKANAYGLGAVPVAQAALAGGATWLAVARTSEAVELRAAGLRAPILHLAYFTPDEAPTLVQQRVTPTVVDLTAAAALAAAVPSGRRITVQLKLDTGLSRFGTQPAELEPLLRGLRQFSNLRVEGVYSHLASADEADLSFARQQLAAFQTSLRQIEAAGHQVAPTHLANSAGALALPEARLDLVRLGITLSGHYPSTDVPRTATLRPAAALRARLARVYTLPAGASIGYNRTRTLDQPRRVGLVPVGYADGLPRAHSNHGAVLINGQRSPLLGRVSMDQCVIDLQGQPRAQPGDLVTLFGAQDTASISLDDFAAWGDTVAHEALCRIGPRVPRCYLGLTGPTAARAAPLAVGAAQAD
jgi:alanine racemase